jgi:hypothetical protein
MVSGMRIGNDAKWMAAAFVMMIGLLQMGLAVDAQEYVEPVDLLIIAHEDFLPELERLAEWKNSTGVPTAIVSWQDMVSDYAGSDWPERIKRGIKFWHESRRVKYVMLVGDADMFPVRYITLDWGAHTPDPDHIPASDFVFSASDLYYADLYNASEDFDDWDYDKNGFYGELWGANNLAALGPINHDRIDMYPDVAVGRVPASSTFEVANFVEKVISYESNVNDAVQNWLKNCLLIAEGVDDLGHYDHTDDVESKLVAAGFSVTKYCDVDNSNRPRPSHIRPDWVLINNELAYGKGLLNFAGHGNRLYAPSYGNYGSDYNVYLSQADGSSFNESKRIDSFFCRDLLGTPAVGDYDGDSDTDVIFIQLNGTVWTAETQPSGLLWSDFHVDLSPHFAAMTGYPLVADVTGDFKDDLIQFNRTSGEVYVSVSWGYTFDPVQVWSIDFCVGSYSCFTGDFNGDGISDIGYRHGADIYVSLSHGTGFMGKNPWLNGPITDATIVVGDYNGDSNDDLAFVNVTSGNVFVATSNGQQFAFNSSYSYSSLCPGDISYGAIVRSGDFWGDGTDDLVVFLRDSRIGGKRTVGEGTFFERGDVYVLSTDAYGFCAGGVWKDSFSVESNIPAVGNFNHDGADDIIEFHRNPAAAPFAALNNKDKYPIVFAASCSTGEYAIIPPWHEYRTVGGATQPGTNDGTVFPLTLFQGMNLMVPPAPDPLQPYDVLCIAEQFLVHDNVSGAVAYIGGVEVLQGDCMELDRLFIESYTSGENILGNMWNEALENFLDANSYGHGEQTIYSTGWGDLASYHHPSKMMLFGDPSLRVFSAPAPTAPPIGTIPPVHIVIIGGGIAAGLGVIVYIRRIRNVPLIRR